MKLLLLTDGIYPYVVGGMQKHSYYLSRLLPLNNVQLILVHCVNHNEKIPSEQEVFDEVFKGLTEDELEVAKTNFKSICLKFPEPKTHIGHYLKESFQYSSDIFEVIKGNLADFDFIYAKGFAGWKLIDEKKKGLKCPPVGVKFHGLNMFQKAANFKAKMEHLMFRGPVKFNMKNADYVFSYGGKITDITRQIVKDDSKILEFPTGIGEDWIVEEPKIQAKRTFLYVGRYERLKGIEELYQAINMLDSNLEYEFKFVGPIPESKKLKHPKVSYLGVIMDADKLKEVYQSCDILVCPSYSEGMPNVIMEAMAQGLSVIATDTGATSVIVNNSTGWLLNFPNVSKIYNAMTSAISTDDNKLLEMRLRAIDGVKDKLLWTDIAKRLVKKIKEITS